MYDLVVRNGKIFDGSGLAPFHAAIGVKNGRIVRVGRIVERGAREIDATGCIVTPGFIDGHTHVDAQVNWDPLLAPSCLHGVTSVVMGNCGFTIAPIRKGCQEMVVQDLERAEDIPREAMMAGIAWNWETFPEYLDYLDTLPKAINTAANVGHSALRTWAMGERALSDEASQEDLELMRGQLREALRAGAIGFSTSMAPNHARTDGRPVASRNASWTEIRGLVEVLGEEGLGIFEIARGVQTRQVDAEGRAAMKRLTDLSVDFGIPVTFAMSVTSPLDEATILDQLEAIETANAQGGRIVVQSQSKDFNMMLSFETQLPFDKVPVWKELRAKPLAEQAVMLRDPALRARLIEAADNAVYGPGVGAEARAPNYDLIHVFDSVYPPWKTIAELAKARNQHPIEVIIDTALEKDLKQWFLQKYHRDCPDLSMKIMTHPASVVTISDTGAHVGQVSDANVHTYLLGYWVKIRRAFSLEQAVQMITYAPARAWGLSDRGLIREGMAADLNVIDFERLAPRMPELVRDLPGGARRIMQTCEGMRATIVNGEVILEDGVPTGATPGKLLRGDVAAAL
jgi:N-acyl-D-aspartate/D-glutamate deacylase